MLGIELSKKYYEEFGRPMFERDFSPYLDRIAVGLVGHGSECFGFDDEISRDHDFAPGFCIWITEEDDREFGFRLMRAYAKLPKEFLGIKCADKSLGGSNALGVHTINSFYSEYTGREGAPESWQDWLFTPSHYFAEATNGEIFADPLGEFSRIRSIIKEGMPEDVRLKRIACCLLHMAQAGQYNYKRCIAHGENGAARLALAEFAEYAAEIAFLLEKQHAPYYKWIFRAMRLLPHLSHLAQKLEEIITLPSEETLKIELAIESYCKEIVSELNRQGIIQSDCDYLEPHAFAVNASIKNPEIRNLHIYYNND
ncbi:MAG: DUF4037 domain-containing protein [Clostridia bacterium]|nr:DUF4037 domain-containing protein [Clostridia bacterium]